MNPAYIIFALAAVAFVCGVFVVAAMLLAPEGYEDETGFHRKDEE